MLAFVLGIGLPTVSVYILTATLLAPALVKLGVTPMAAHMFVMYNGMLSMITPPVAFAAYAAANIARTDGWTTGWVACLVGWSTFILPFLFVLTPSLLMDGPAHLIAWNFCRILFGLFVGTAGIVGFALAPLSLPARLVYGALALRSCCRRKRSPARLYVNLAGIGMSALLLAVDHLRRPPPFPGRARQHRPCPGRARACAREPGPRVSTTGAAARASLADMVVRSTGIVAFSRLPGSRSPPAGAGVARDTMLRLYNRRGAGRSARSSAASRSWQDRAAREARTRHAPTCRGTGSC